MSAYNIHLLVPLQMVSVYRALLAKGDGERYPGDISELIYPIAVRTVVQFVSPVASVSPGYAARAHRHGPNGITWRHKLRLARGPDFSDCTA